MHIDEGPPPAHDFGPDSREVEYEQRLKAAYPIHPEIFDRLYTDWSTLLKFQRTRGVLRLMAAVIHSLWEKGDRSPLILPANIPIDDPRWAGVVALVTLLSMPPLLRRGAISTPARSR